MVIGACILQTKPKGPIDEGIRDKAATHFSAMMKQFAGTPSVDWTSLNETP
jgi:hypothetical protein